MSAGDEFGNASYKEASFDIRREEKIDEYNYRKATSDMSVFYGSESDSDVSDYSILSYRYKNYNK